MADEADQSVETQQLALERALHNQRTAAQHARMRPKGACHFCDEPVATQILFCDEDCRDDYDYEQQQRQRHFIH